MDTCSDTEKAKATELTAMGLPEGQAVASAKALTTGTTPSASATSVYAMMSINEDADLEALKLKFTDKTIYKKNEPKGNLSKRIYKIAENIRNRRNRQHRRRLQSHFGIILNNV